MPPHSELIEYHQAPEWLTKEFLEKVLQNYKNDPLIMINDIEIRPASAKGEHYASVMTRVKLDYTSKCGLEHSINCIVKTTFEGDEFVNKIFSLYKTFQTEMNFYEYIVPQIRELLKEIKDEDENMFPDVIFVDRLHEAIIFEDLSVKKFVNANRTEGLDVIHIKMALTKMAKLHASTAVLNEHYPGIFQNFQYGVHNRNTQGFAPFFENGLRSCSETVKSFGKEYIEIGEKIERLVPKVMDVTAELFDPGEKQFNALNHGDFWTNNLMCFYGDEGAGKKPTDLKLIDFQFSSWSSPAIDLHYFFNTSLKDEFTNDHQDEFVQYYYYILVDTLKALKYRGMIPTLRKFWIEFAEKSFYAIPVAFVSQAIMLCDETTDADFNALMGTDERSQKFRRTIYGNLNTQKKIKNLLPVFDRRGLLDL